MDRIKRRIALCLAASALISVLAATPAAAADNCHPAPDAVCNSRKWVVECVVWIVKYGHAADYCDT